MKSKDKESAFVVGRINQLTTEQFQSPREVTPLNFVQILDREGKLAALPQATITYTTTEDSEQLESDLEEAEHLLRRASDALLHPNPNEPKQYQEAIAKQILDFLNKRHPKA